MGLTLALTFAAMPIFAASPHLITDLDSPRHVDYLIIAADHLAHACAPLLEHRQACGYGVGLVPLSAIAGAQSGPPESTVALTRFIARARHDWGVRFLLLVGDAAGPPGQFVPMVVTPSGYYSTEFLSDRDVATDYDYAAGEDGLPALHIGRLPADTPDELASMVHRIIEYETSLPAGDWQARVSFVVGRAGFSEFIDAVLESQFTQILTADLPGRYQVSLLHGNASSPLCPYPPQFLRETLDMLNAGSLFFVYVGHGRQDELDDVHWSGGRAPILRVRDLAGISIREGAPVMAVIACDTAKIDDASTDSLGEQVLKRPAGPVGYIGSTRICQPYGNALLGRGLVQAAFSQENATLGEILDAARRIVLEPDASPFRQQADAMAGMVQGPQNLPGMRRDVVRHYVLLGDPATRLRFPASLQEFQVRPEADRVLVNGRASISTATGKVTLSRPMSSAMSGTRDEPATREGYEARYRAASRFVIAESAIAAPQGRFSVSLRLDQPLSPGTYTIRASIWDDSRCEIGSVTFDVPNP
ncbi:MAG: hypothetical protein HPY44_16850 [Armatimonadetes bacterium]|nr:hypothetical protein [Armatimonadota bacterium]